MRRLALTILLSAASAMAQTVTSITILPDPVNGYSNTINTTLQLGVQVCYSDNNCDSGRKAGGVAWSVPAAQANLLSVNSSGLVTFPNYNNVGTAALPASPTAGQVAWITNPSGGTLSGCKSRPATAGNLAVPCIYNPSTGARGWQSGFSGIVAVTAGGTTVTHNVAIFTFNPSAITSTCFTPLPASEAQFNPSLTSVVGTRVVINASFNSCTEGNGEYWDETYAAWSTTTPSICSVDQQGGVTGIATGACNVTTKWQGHTQSTAVTIVAPTNTATGANCPAGSGITFGTCWYIRPNGGPRYRTGLAGDSCNGQADADMTVGGGANQACAFSHPEYIYTDDSNNGQQLQFAIQGGDTVIVRGGPYTVGQKCLTAGKLVCDGTDGHVAWGFNAETATGSGQFSGGFYLPSGPVGHPTQLLGENWQNPTHDNETKLIAFYGGHFDVRGAQNITIKNIDFGNSNRCILYTAVAAHTTILPNTTTTNWCAGTTRDSHAMILDNFSANIDLEHDYFHGFNEGMSGGPGPGLTVNDLRLYRNNFAGTNFDDPEGVITQAAGINAVGLDVEYSGFSEEYPIQKPVSSATCDGNWNEKITFSQNENFVAPRTSHPTLGNTILLSGFTPSAYNTPTKANVVSADWSNQQVSITGGICIDHSALTTNGMVYVGNGRFKECRFTTSSAPTFAVGDTVVVSGATPSWTNTAWLVNQVSSTGFVTVASEYAPAGVVNPQFTQFCDGGWSATMTYASGATVYYSSTGYSTGGNYYVSLTSGNLNNNPAMSTANWAVTTNGICSIAPAGVAGTERTLTVANNCGSAGSASTVGTAQHPNPVFVGTDQGSLGYGDGIGTANTSGSWIFDHSKMIRNAQDGFDLLHSISDKVWVTNSLSYGNEGQSLKMGITANGIIKNNVLIANCARNGVFDPDQPPTAHHFFSMLCRAGDGVVVGIYPYSHVNISGNTFVSGQGAMLSLDGALAMGAATAVVQDHNNIEMSYYDPLTKFQLPQFDFYCEVGPCPHANSTNNISWNNRNNSTVCTSANPTWMCIDPQLTYEIGSPASSTAPCSSEGGFCLQWETDADNWNFKPQAGSPAIGAGVTGYDMSPDMIGMTRPSPPSIGAMEYAAPAPVF